MKTKSHSTWKITGAILIFLISGRTATASDLVVRATELNQKFWSEMETNRKNNVIIEFRQGDLLPLVFQAQGDFLQSTDTTQTNVLVKKSFWIKIKEDKILMSLDAQLYKPFQEIVTGSLTLGANSSSPESGLAHGIQVLLQALLK